MEWIKKNILFVVTLVIFIILLGVGGYMLNEKINQRAEVANDLESKKIERDNLRDKQPSPVSKNVEQTRKNADELSASLAESLEILRRGRLSFEEMEGLQCKQEIVNATRHISGLLDQYAVVYPAKTLFGFERYSDATITPRKEDSPLLQKQLKVTEEIARCLGEARISQLVSIRRVEFEVGATATSVSPDGTPAAPAASRTSRTPTLEPLISLGTDFTYVNAPGYIYTTMPFEVQIKGNTEAFRSFLNLLARSNHVLIPRILNVDNDEKQGPPNPSATPHGSAAHFRKEPGSGTSMDLRPDLPPDQHPIIMGDELLAVGMRIEWLEFQPEETASKPARK